MPSRSPIGSFLERSNEKYAFVSMGQLTDKEIRILGQVLRQSKSSQRDLSRTTGISLGLINVILKKLLKAGMIKISQLNKRKMEYLLTHEGFLEAANRVYKSTITTIKKYKIIETNLAGLLRELHGSGYDYFSIHGDGDLKDLTEATFQRCLEDAPVTLGREHRKDPRAVVLNVTTDTLNGGTKWDVVNVLEKLRERVWVEE